MNRTDWNNYYERPYKTAAVTRRITAFYLTRQLLRSLKTGHPSIIELGGANSCFVDVLYTKLDPAYYTIIDNNEFGLSLLKHRKREISNLILVNDDVLNPRMEAAVDLVFSVGLIEHFDTAGTRAAIDTHFRLARPGGLVLIGFPTPTWLYRATRRLFEFLKLWQFPDERALSFGEVFETISQHGVVQAKILIWPIFLTQGLLLCKKYEKG
ncbi:MAG: class I SAM-dependent methyltransferase [Deltaproteobacteria bacterium]|nr:class I SAM-dependent methyltransferase [Deltaproteobacteria bacterium]